MFNKEKYKERQKELFSFLFPYVTIIRIFDNGKGIFLASNNLNMKVYINSLYLNRHLLKVNKGKIIVLFFSCSQIINFAHVNLCFYINYTISQILKPILRESIVSFIKKDLETYTGKDSSYLLLDNYYIKIELLFQLQVEVNFIIDALLDFIKYLLIEMNLDQKIFYK